MKANNIFKSTAVLSILAIVFWTIQGWKIVHCLGDTELNYYDRCKIITRSGSLYSVNLDHDNSCNEKLWILKGYTGFKKQ